MNVDKESFASLMGLKEQLKVKQEEEARIAAEKEQKRKEAAAKAHEFEPTNTSACMFLPTACAAAVAS